MPLVDSPLGPIPAGWEVNPLLDQADLVSGGTPKTSVPDYWGGSIAWASAADLLVAPITGNRSHAEYVLVDGLIELNRSSVARKAATS